MPREQSAVHWQYELGVILLARCCGSEPWMKCSQNLVTAIIGIGSVVAWVGGREIGVGCNDG